MMEQDGYALAEKDLAIPWSNKALPSFEGNTERNFELAPPHPTPEHTRVQVMQNIGETTEQEPQ